MNVLIFNLRLDADDGVLGFTTDWVNAIASRCDKVVVITMYAGSLRVESNVTVYSAGLEFGHSKARRLVAFYALLLKVLREHSIDVCFTHMNYLFALLGAPMLKVAGVPILLWYAHKAVTPSLRAVERVVDAVVTSSPTGFQAPSRKVTIVGQGIDTERFSPAPQTRAEEGVLRLLSLGRISRIKRLEVLLDALAHLRSTEPQVAFECLIVGDPLSDDCRAYFAELKAKRTAVGLDDLVRFRPGIPFYKAQHVFRDADIFLNPGDTDSVDKTGLEALSCGVQLITSNIAFADILPADMQSASIVPKNDPQAFAAAIVRMARWSGEERRASAQRGRETVAAHHSIDSLANKLIAAMEALIAKRKVPGFRWPTTSR